MITGGYSDSKKKNRTVHERSWVRPTTITNNLLLESRLGSQPPSSVNSNRSNNNATVAAAAAKDETQKQQQQLTAKRATTGRIISTSQAHHRNNRPSNSQEGQGEVVSEMASFAPPSGAWPVDHDEFGNAVWRNQDARQVHHMYNMPGQLPPPLPALSPRVPFGPETHNPHFPGQLTLPPPALSPRGAFMPEAHYPHLPPGPDFTSSTRPLAEFPPLEHGPTEWITSPSFPLNNSTGIAATPQTPPPTLLSSKKEEEAKHWTQECNANGKKYYLNTLTMEWQLETPDCLKKYTTK